MTLATIVFSGREWILPSAIITLVLVAVVVWSMHRATAQRGVRVGCALLKTIGILTLALCLLEPLWVSQRARPGANYFAIIADNSQGLQVKDAGATRSRGEVLHDELTGDNADWRTRMAEHFQLRRYMFDSRLQSTPDFAELKFNGQASSLGAALKTAVEQWRGQPVAGILLFTDGNATDIAGELPSLDGCPPIYPVVLGTDDDIRDVSLKKIGVTQTAFEDAPVTAQVEVNAGGLAGIDITTRVREIASTTGSNHTILRVSSEPKVVAEQSQRANANNADLGFRFQIQPETPGIHFYELETRIRDEARSPDSASREATLVNNRKMIVVDRGQEPFRVLYVSGRPNWEYKFLNRAVQEDAQVQLVSLIRVARREPRFEFKGRAGESSNPLFRGFDRKDEETARYDQPVLIRLNTRDALELRGGFPRSAEELFQYHAIIVDDLESEFFTHDQMSLVQRFVSERGGGFLMLGGADSLREGNYAGSPIASILPVYVDRDVEVPPAGDWKLDLTREGWLQPWTRLRSIQSEEQERLDAMPAFGVVNPVRDIKPGASVLATVSYPDGRTVPALAVQRFGFGRSASLMIGDMWAWGLRDENLQKDLGKAWRQLVRWLVADVPSRVSVAAEPGGDPTVIRLTVKARDEEYKPLDNATARVIVRPVKMIDATGDTNYIELTAEPSTSQPGNYETTFIAREAGAYSVEAVVTHADGKIAGRSGTGWTSDPAAEEFRSLKPNRALLESLAQRTGGEVIAMSDLNSFAGKLPERRAPITETWSSPLWHNPSVFLFALCCFVAEWGLRRWKGLP